jgi:hypothetical protein
VSIALILLSIAWLPVSAPYSKLLWLAGTGLHLLLTLYVITQWMHQGKFEIVHLNPAWFIPVVGNILVPIAGVSHAPVEVSWFFFSVGLLFWPVLLTIIIYRVIFHGSLPERLMPTLFILIAPPAVGFLSYLKLTGELDAFAHVLYHGALFFTLLLFTQLRWFTGSSSSCPGGPTPSPWPPSPWPPWPCSSTPAASSSCAWPASCCGITTVVIAGLLARRNSAASTAGNPASAAITGRCSAWISVTCRLPPEQRSAA